MLRNASNILRTKQQPHCFYYCSYLPLQIEIKHEFHPVHSLFSIRYSCPSRLYLPYFNPNISYVGSGEHDI